MNKKQQTINTYNKSAKILSNKFDDLGARIADIEEVFSYLDKKNLNVLEIGCGNGRDAKEILKHVSEGRYLGIDVSNELIKIAKEKVPEGKFEIADIEQCIFPKNIDLIFAFASLIHSDKNSFRKILDSAYDSLNKSGIVFISLKHGAYAELTKEDEFGTRTYYFYDENTINELVKNKYEILKLNVHNLRNQEWLDIIMRKI